MRRLMRECVRRYLGWIVLAVVCMAVMAAATAVTAWMMKPVVNDVFIDKNRDILWLVGPWLGAPSWPPSSSRDWPITARRP